MNEDLNAYIEAASESSSRVRTVILVLLTGSVIVFGALWNMRVSGWAISRLRCAEDAYQYLGTPAAARDVAGSRYPNLRHGQLCAEIYRLATVDDASAFLAESRANLNALRQNLKLPFFDVTFDSRDLGVLSGLAFGAMLLWLRFALWHEHHNLRRVFALCPPDRLQHCYRLLAMRQVLTTPPSLTNEPRPEHLWRFAVRLLFVLPLMLQLYAYSADFRILSLSRTIGGFGATVSFTVASLFMLISLLLTISALRLAAATDKRWVQTARTVRERSTVADLKAAGTSADFGQKVTASTG